MRTFFILGWLLIAGSACMAQSDLLVLKKKGKTIKTFFPDTDMHFSTDFRYFDANIASIRKDSINLIQYDVRRVQLSHGGVMLDTVGMFPFSIHYKDITAIRKETAGFSVPASGMALMGGGALLTTAGLLSWVLAEPNSRYYARPELVVTAAALTGIGYLILRSHKDMMPIGKKYSLHYIPLH